MEQEVIHTTVNPDRYRKELPPIPARLLRRPVERGYPVPWFCAEVDGHWDFRIVDARKFKPAIQHRRCWVCGEPLGSHLAFTIGPMCAINRTISEPPSHRECAEWSARACPFLNQRETKRREGNLPEDGTYDPTGHGIMRQPGVVLLWVTKSYRVIRVGDGLLFKIGDPLETHWYRGGRAATRAEILESIESGYPILLEAAQRDGNGAVQELEAARVRAMLLLPGDGVPL